MAKPVGQQIHRAVVKRTRQGGKAKTSGMNKSQKRSYKPYRGQGK